MSASEAVGSRPLSFTVFVYFRSARDARERVSAALSAQLDAVARATGVRGRTGLRRDTNVPYLTWLEVYEPVPADALQRLLDEVSRCAESLGLAALAPQGRHCEVFEQRDAD